MIQIDPDALLVAVADRIAANVIGQPGGDFDVRVNVAIKQAIDGIVRERVAAMIDRLLVERASETFAACDGAVELVRAETMRAARQRVAENLPSKDDVRRESLAIVRDAVMRTFEPVVAKVAEVANGVGIAFDPNPMSFPVPVPSPDDPPPGFEWLPPVPAGMDPLTPPWNGRAVHGAPNVRNGRPVRAISPIPTPAVPQPKRHGEPGGPGGDCMAGVQTAPCECYGCSPPF